MPNVSDILKAFAEETRLRILRLVALQALSVNELVEALRTGQPRISRHLAVLKRAGLVADRRDGNRTFYSMPAERLEGFPAAVWEAVVPRQAEESFFPEDLVRCQKVLAARKARSKEYFDAVARQWDRIKRNYISDAVPFMVVAKLLGPGALAVDVGTGTGEALAALAATGARVIGVDSSEKMLQVCRQRVAEAGLENVELRLGEAEALPLADGECDTALASMVLHHLAEPAAGAREMARVVRPGGKVVIIDLVSHAQEWTREVMADVWMGFSEADVRSWLTGSGLGDVTYSASSIPSPAEEGPSEKLETFIAVASKPARAD
jgi:ubiquinone/menaquinone biosynthesis C-methylase UbiE